VRFVQKDKGALLQFLDTNQFSLTPKRKRSFFSKKCSNLPFIAQEANTIFVFFKILTVRS
jgi:hypothetical protein